MKKIYIYKFLNSKGLNRNAVHSFVKKLDLTENYKINLSGNFIELILPNKNEKLENLKTIELTYFENIEENFFDTKNPKHKSNLIKSDLFLISTEEKEMDEINNNDEFYLRGNIVFNLQIKGEENKKINLLDNTGKLRKEYKDKDVFEEVKNYFRQQCHDKYGFDIYFDYSNFSKCNKNEKFVYLSTKENFRLFNLINVDLKIIVVNKEKFEKIFYNNVFAKKSYGCGYLNIIKI